jgi:outer membrane protein assembly factor BamB
VLFGSADGTVSCLRLSDGEVIWRFRAAPHDRRIVANEQLESVWPVSGSVLVRDGAVYFAAGRTSYLDGGIFLYKLDAHSGRVLKAVTLEVEQAKRDRGVVSGGHLPDVLSAVDASIFMRSARFDEDLVRQKDDVAHLWSSVGFLDDSWWHRTYWQFGTSMRSGWGGWPKAGRTVPAGRLLATDGERIVGFGRNQYDIPGAHVGVDGQEAWGPVGNGLSRWTFYRLFARPLDEDQAEGTAPSSKGGGWSRRIPVLAQAIVLADNTVFVAGPEDPLSDRVAHEPSDADPVAEALNATEGGRLLAVSLADGTILSSRPLESPPVFDGMAAAANRLYVSTKKGQVVCLAAKESVPPRRD